MARHPLTSTQTEGAGPAAPLALRALLVEVNDLKRVHSAGRTGSIAERLFAQGWGALTGGAAPEAVALDITAKALAAARLCALNVLAQLQAAVGDLDHGVVQCIRLGGFINAVPTFAGLAGIMNGASDLVVEILGDRGRHARSTVGVAELPLDAAVEVEAMFEVK